MRIAPFELRLEQTGRFLGYRGSPRPLPPGWETWNAYQAGTLVGSLALASGPAGQFNWDEADYEGPFFSPGATPALLAPAAVVARMECVYIAPSQRGGELWHRYTDILTALHLPVYLTFANSHLRDRLQAAHRPLPDPREIPHALARIPGGAVFATRARRRVGAPSKCESHSPT